MNAPKALRALVRRAATYERPFNTQDSLLLLKALHALRYRSNDVRGVCEKCAFAIASARTTVPVERAVDALNALLSLQAAPLPIVHDKLMQRLLEVTPQTVSPRSAQKAAVVVMKLGRRYGTPQTADHIFDVLAQLAAAHPGDVSLQLAVVSVFPYTSSAERDKRATAQPAERGLEDARVHAVLAAAVHVVDARALHALRGNSALQALHMLPILSRHAVSRDANRHESGAGDAEAWERVARAFRGELQLSSVVPGGYAQFLYDFLPSFRTDSASDDVVRVLAVVYCDTFRKALNSYDVAKIAMAVSHALTTRQLRQIPQGGETPLQHTLVRVVESLVAQLEFFHGTSWALPGGGAVDQVAVGAVWRVTQKCVCEVRAGSEVLQRDIVARLVRLTNSLAARLPGVWSWVLYSMSMCARTAVYTDGLGDCMEAVVKESFLVQRPRTVPVRTCVQALYAMSVLMVQSVEEKELMRRSLTPEAERQRIDRRIARWGPEHPLIADMLHRLQQYRYREYPADDVPMLLQGLANLAEATAERQRQLPQSALQMMESVLYYVRGNRNAEWYRRHAISTSCTLLAMGEFLPENSELKEATKEFLCHVQAHGLMEIGALCRLMEYAVALKRKSALPLWTREHILALAVEHIPHASTEWNVPVHLVLDTVELAHELGASLTFVKSVKEASGVPGTAMVLLDIAALVETGALSPVDAAHALRLMSYEVQSFGTLRVREGNIAQLRRIAVGDGTPAAMRVQTLLHLLRANASMHASRALFDEASLVAIMGAVCHQLTGPQEQGNSSRIVHALLSSQVLLRLKRSLQSYEGLAEAVNSVLDGLEASKAEKAETLFQLRLMCGS